MFVRGQFFTSVLKPLMYLSDRNGQVMSESSVKHCADKFSIAISKYLCISNTCFGFQICQVINSSSMICPSPSLKPSVAKWKRHTDSDDDDDQPNDEEQKSDFSEYDRFEVGFVMDGVPSVRRLPPSFGMVVVPDPVYEKFPNGKKLHRGDQLILEVCKFIDRGIGLTVAKSLIYRDGCCIWLVHLKTSGLLSVKSYVTLQ